MSITVSIVEGPNIGEVFNFPDDVDWIEVGRDPQYCQVFFPSDYTQVGRRHFGIRRLAGRYKLELNARNHVLIDGREPFDGEPLGETHLIQLGSSGPKLRVETHYSDALPLTDPVERREAPSQIVHLQRRSLRRVSAGVAGLVVAALALGWWFWTWRGDLTAQIAQIASKTQNREDVKSISSEMLSRVGRSLYVVLVRNAQGAERTVGTAWAYSRDALATNAHVAETFFKLQPGERLAARGTVAPYDTLTIDSVRMHPDYAAFSTAWDKFSPVRADPDAAISNVSSPGAGYDVALMTVSPGSQVAPALQLAERQALENLRAGDAVAFVGFPMEQLAGGGLNPKQPVPQSQVGHITAMSDYFLLPGRADRRHLVQHSLPTTGGASGSPVFDAEGKVVALISGMNIIMLGTDERAPNAAGVNFAQRADLLQELAKPLGPEDEAARRREWQAGFSTFDDPVEKVPLALLSQWMSQTRAGAKAAEVDRRTLTLESSPDGARHAATFGGLMRQPGDYLIVSVCRERCDIDMGLLKGRETLAIDDGTNWHPTITHSKTGDDDLTIAIVTGAADAPPKVDFYLWRLGPVAAGSGSGQ